MTRYARSRLRIELGRSRHLAVALAGAHLLAGAGLLASRLPVPICTAGVVVLASSLAFSLRRHAWRQSPGSIVLLDLSDALEIEVEERCGRRIVGTVLESTFVAPWLVVINCHVKGSYLPRAAVILPDAMDGERFRALRVWLRWRRTGTRAP